MLVMQEGKQVTDFIYAAKKILIIPTKQSSLDGFCAGVGLFRSLKAAGKTVDFAYPYQIPPKIEALVSKEEITQVEGTRGLEISVDYNGTPVEKVNYAVEEHVFKLVLHPVAKDFDLSKVSFKSVGFDYDLVISLGAKNLAEHEVLVGEYGQELKETAIINIDNSNINENFGLVNVVEPEAGSLCTLVLQKLVSWHYKIDKDISKILLAGLVSL